MFPNYQIMFVVGAIGIIFSFILLLISIVKNIKKFKIISILLITVFVVILSMGIALGYFYYENSKNIMEQSNTVEQEVKVTSGNIENPIVIKEETFFSDDKYYYSEFSITNNTNIEISKISFRILFTPKDGPTDVIYNESVFLLDSIIPPRKTVVENYIWKKDSVKQPLLLNEVKLTDIKDVIVFVKVNNEEKRINLEELKAMDSQ